MKKMAGVVVMAVVMLTACGSVPGEAQVQGGEAAPSEQNLRTQEFALSGDCSVSLECSGGLRISCNGTQGRCLASTGLHGGSVTCNLTGTPQTTPCEPTIPIPPCGCKRDGCCSQFCALDPDCT